MLYSVICALGTSVLLFTCLYRGNGSVLMSSEKMTMLAACEESLLNLIARGPSYGIPSSVSKLNSIADFRRNVLKAQPAAEVALHPNGAYLMVQAFIHFWNDVIKNRPEFNQAISTFCVDLPDKDDLDNAMAGIVRLQRVYKLRTADVYAGNFSGYLGPALSPLDALAIGSKTFSEGILTESVDWLNLTLTLMERNSQRDVPVVVSHPLDKGRYSVQKIASVKALMGRAFIYKGDEKMARKMYREAIALDSTDDNALLLREELISKPFEDVLFVREVVNDTFSRLCSRPKHQLVEGMKKFHTCRYKPSLFLPYLRYKEEVLCLSPYASLFHDVLTSKEAEFLKNKAMEVVIPAMLEDKVQPIRRAHLRNGVTGWLTDDMREVLHLSTRVQDVTWLKALNRYPDEGPWTGEHLQVVNYGIGGHYYAHVDYLNSNPLQQAEGSGNRLATFMFYLTDVEIGGHTVFLKEGISVPPVQGTALFWYNYTPAQEPDPRTEHASCPVLKGQKWVSNKWIWTYGNTFRRPCGSKNTSVQTEVERIAFSRRHSIWGESWAEDYDEDD